MVGKTMALYNCVAKDLIIENKKSGCWEWQCGLSTQKNGINYGSLAVRSGGKLKITRAHRFMYELFKGKIKNSLYVLHKCDNPLCVNPSHLFLGTHDDNMKDCVSKGRHWAQKRTKCPLDHPLKGKNLYVSPLGVRGCKKCRIAASRRYEKRKARLDQPV